MTMRTGKDTRTPKTTIIVPSRNEEFLVKTCLDLLAKARGQIEVFVVLDGYYNVDLPNDKRLKWLHRGTAQGMRPAINSIVRMSQSDYLMKIDAHCMVKEGFDVDLISDCDADWIVVPRRYSLNPEAWTFLETGKAPVDAHYLSYPFERPGDSKCGLHGTVWNKRARERQDVLIDDEMSSQGSCWFMSRQHWDRLGEMEVSKYGNFIQEFQELGLKTWLGGGQVKVNKKTWYAHLHKGQRGRGYFISKKEMENGADFATKYWMTDSWKERVHDLKWLIEKFSPVPGWPADLDAAFAAARKKFAP